MAVQPASIASEFLRFGMNVWPEAAAEEGEPIVHRQALLKFPRRIFQIAACLAVIMAASLFLVAIGKNQVVSKESLERTYLAHGPQIVERIWVELDGQIRLVKVQHLDSPPRNAIVVKILETRLISQNDIEPETERIWAKTQIR